MILWRTCRVGRTSRESTSLLREGSLWEAWRSKKTIFIKSRMSTMLPKMSLRAQLASMKILSYLRKATSTLEKDFSSKWIRSWDYLSPSDSPTSIKSGGLTIISQSTRDEWRLSLMSSSDLKPRKSSTSLMHWTRSSSSRPQLSLTTSTTPNSLQVWLKSCRKWARMSWWTSIEAWQINRFQLLKLQLRMTGTSTKSSASSTETSCANQSWTKTFSPTKSSSIRSENSASKNGKASASIPKRNSR